MPEEIDAFDANKATEIVRNFLQDNYGNISLLLYRIMSVTPNTEKNVYKVVCSILPNIGARERIIYLLKINVEKQKIVDVYMGEEKEKDGRKFIELKKIDIKDEEKVE